MIRRTDQGSTPVYDSVWATAVDGIPFATGYPPHHPDIYRQLCAEFGHDPRDGAHAAATDAAGRTRAPGQRRGRRRAGADALPWWQGRLSPA